MRLKYIIILMRKLPHSLRFLDGWMWIREKENPEERNKLKSTKEKTISRVTHLM